MLYEKNGALILERKGETLCIYAQGKNALRVRSTMNPEFAQTDWALAGATAGKAEIEISESCARIKNGKISATVTRLGQINFFREQECILQEYYRCYEYDSPHTPSLRVRAREFKPIRGGDYALTVRFESADGEKIRHGAIPAAVSRFERLHARTCAAQFADLRSIRALLARIRLFVEQPCGRAGHVWQKYHRMARRKRKAVRLLDHGRQHA